MSGGWITRVRSRSIAAAMNREPFKIVDTHHRTEIGARFHAWWINWMGPGEDYQFATAFPNARLS